jgi:hypothetical protein
MIRIPGGTHPIGLILENVIETLTVVCPRTLRVIGCHQHKTRRLRGGQRAGFLQQRAHDVSSNETTSDLSGR